MFCTMPSILCNCPANPHLPTPGTVGRQKCQTGCGAPAPILVEDLLNSKIYKKKLNARLVLRFTGSQMRLDGCVGKKRISRHWVWSTDIYFQQMCAESPPHLETVVQKSEQTTNLEESGTKKRRRKHIMARPNSDVRHLATSDCLSWREPIRMLSRSSRCLGRLSGPTSFKTKYFWMLKGLWLW